MLNQNSIKMKHITLQQQILKIQKTSNVFIIVLFKMNGIIYLIYCYSRNITTEIVFSIAPIRSILNVADVFKFYDLSILH